MITGSDAQLLARLRRLAPRIERVEAGLAEDYAERLAIWLELIDRGLDRKDIAAASNITTGAINVKLHALRKAQGK